MNREGYPRAPIAAFARGSARSSGWVGILTVHDSSISVLIFLILSHAPVARPLAPSRLRPSARPSSLRSLASGEPHTSSRGPAEPRCARDRSRKNSIDANPSDRRLERGRASTKPTREPTDRRRVKEKRDREEIPELSSGPRRGEAVYDGDAMTTNGFATPFKEGTIKHACYVALERAGAEGLTVRARDDGPGAILDAGGGCPMGVRLVLRHGP